MRVTHFILVLTDLDTAPIDRETQAIVAINDYIQGEDENHFAPFDWAEISSTSPTLSFREGREQFLKQLQDLRVKKAAEMEKHFDNITSVHCKDSHGGNPMERLFLYINQLKDLEDAHPEPQQLGYELRRIGELMEGCYRAGSYFYDAEHKGTEMPRATELDERLTKAGANRDFFLIPVTLAA